MIPMNAASMDMGGPMPGVDERKVVAEKKGPSLGSPAEKLAWEDGKRNLISLSRINIGRRDPHAKNLSRT